MKVYVTTLDQKNRLGDSPIVNVTSRLNQLNLKYQTLWALRNLEDEIKKANVSIFVDQDSGRISYENCTDELAEKITAILSSYVYEKVQ